MMKQREEFLKPQAGKAFFAPHTVRADPLLYRVLLRMNATRRSCQELAFRRATDVFASTVVCLPTARRAAGCFP
jgi:hypothetical protein